MISCPYNTTSVCILELYRDALINICVSFCIFQRLLCCVGHNKRSRFVLFHCKTRSTTTTLWGPFKQHFSQQKKKKKKTIHKNSQIIKNKKEKKIFVFFFFGFFLKKKDFHADFRDCVYTHT